MGSFPTYGMAGVGIAAAIGFVFVLSFFGNQGGVNDGQLLQSNESALDQQRAATEDESQFAKEMDGANAPASESADMMQLSSAPVLNSIVALDANGELLGEVVPGMELTADELVVIRASIVNQNDFDTGKYHITLGVRASGEELSRSANDPFMDAAVMHGVVSATSVVELEMYWVPQSAGDYTLQVYMTPDELAGNGSGPVAEIPITVSE